MSGESGSTGQNTTREIQTKSLTAKPIPIRVDSGTAIRTGAEAKTQFTGTLVHGERTKHIGPILEKTARFSDADILGRRPGESARYYQKMRRAYKKAGLNVVRWIRTTDTNTIIMPDITADGSALYGKAAQRMLNESRTYQLDQRKPHPLDSQFLELTLPGNFTRVINRAREEMQKATANGISLPSDEDAFELLVHPENPTTSWELITLDLALSSLGAPNDPDIAERNKRMTAEFLADLVAIRAGLLHTGPQQLD